MQWSKLETAHKCKHKRSKLEVLEPQLETIFMRQHFLIQTTNSTLNLINIST